MSMTAPRMPRRRCSPRCRLSRPEVAVVALSRNFGKEAALTAGLDHAHRPRGVIVIDADLQDPPEVIPDLVAAWREGFDVAYAQRRSRAGETWMKRPRPAPSTG